jgi:RNA polymerase sigma-70 factor (ECF subfamily)
MVTSLSALDPAAPEPAGDALERAAREDFQFIWRCLRRLGVQPTHAVDDAAQRVFEIAASKRTRIVPGMERAFLFRTALLVAAEERRAQRRAGREYADDELVARTAADGLAPDQAVEAKQWRSHLDDVLDALEPELRAVFVLYELERLSSPEIAELLGLPLGTVASRLRRARVDFQAVARRLRARLGFEGDLR